MANKPSIEERLIKFAKKQSGLDLDDLDKCTRCRRKTVAYKRCVICGHKEDK